MRPALRPAQLAAGLAGSAVAVTLLAFAVRRAGGEALVAALGRLSWAVLVPALLCEAGVQLSKALKWQGLLTGVGPVSYGSALRGVIIGAASTHVVPLRLDEVLRALVLGRREGLPTGKVLGTVAVDRVLEMLVAGLLLGLLALSAELPVWLSAGARVLWAGFAVGALGLVAFVRLEDRIRPALRGTGLPGAAALASFAGGLAEGVRALPRGAALGRVALGAAGEWTATLVFYAWMLHVFEVAAGEGLVLAMALGNAVAYAVPNVPGALGTYEAVQAGLLEQVAGLGSAEALALALTAHAVLMLPVTGIGLVLGALELRR